MIAGIHIRDPNNIGDQAACSMLYAGYPFDQIDIREPATKFGKYNAVVLGGGGLLHLGLTRKIHAILKIVKKHKGTVIGWGFGANTHGGTVPSWPTWLKEFDLLGIRDWGCPSAHWVPCASCLSPQFDIIRRPPDAEVVVYAHHGTPIPLPQFPHITNDASLDQWPSILNFLANGKTIITSSYHGAYWGLLLGRKVALWKPGSNRFYGFKKPLPIWPEQPAGAPEFLTECRTANLAFLEKAKLLLDK